MDNLQVNLDEFEQVLNEAEIVFLATSANDQVAVRPISIVNLGRTIYVRTEENMRKALQIKANSNVAVSVSNFYFEGVAEICGNTSDPRNAAVKAMYIKRYPEAFGELDGTHTPSDVFIRIQPKMLHEWVFDGNEILGLAEMELE